VTITGPRQQITVPSRRIISVGDSFSRYHDLDFDKVETWEVSSRIFSFGHFKVLSGHGNRIFGQVALPKFGPGLAGRCDFYLNMSFFRWDTDLKSRQLASIISLYLIMIRV